MPRDSTPPPAPPPRDAGATPTPEAALIILTAALSVTPLETAGTRIGPYKLLEEIGQGGFGTVWMAEQQEPIRRRVALKIIKAGMDTREVVARFEAERQALALMEHPNISRAFDAGATEAGRPYFVMELVRGVAITRYCDQHKLSTEARLQLFCTVCSAVQHAHQKGVIHRDLKPSNILVTLHDGAPVPKIIDFGIAKATNGVHLTDKTLFTRFHAFIGTPAYTSPEQVEMSGLDVDTRSDIYSLGVLLYELLTGLPPFDGEALMKSGFEAMRRTIREIDPPRPSTRLGTLDEALGATIALQRGTDRARLPALLRGDLDWIVMRCLEKDRTRRYETAGSLAADIQCYLNHEPVTACPPSRAYWLRKLVRRHRLAFAAGAAVLLALVAGLAASSVLYYRARTAAAKSAEVARFMQDMLAGAGPALARGRDTTLLREILDQTARRLAAELKAQPEVAADLQDTLGPLYRRLGEYSTAAALLRQAVATRRAVQGNHSPELATSLLHLADALSYLGDLSEAETLTREALAIREKRYGPDHPAVLAARAVLASLMRFTGQSEQAEQIGRDILERQRKLLGAESAEVAASLYELGPTVLANGNRAEAVKLVQESVAIRRKLFGTDHPDVADALNDLGDVIGSEDAASAAAAAAAYRESLAIRRKLLGDGHQEVEGLALQLALVLTLHGRQDEAIALLREVLAGVRQAPGHSTDALGMGLIVLGALLEHPGGNPGEARALTTEAHALFQQEADTGARYGPHIGGPAFDFGFQLFLAGRPTEALPILREHYQLLQATRQRMQALHQPGADDDQYALVILESKGWLGLCYLHSGLAGDAVPLFEENVPQRLKLFGPQHQVAMMSLAALGAAYRETGRLADAQRVLEERLALFAAKTAGSDLPDVAIGAVRAELGLTLLGEGKFAPAEIVLRQALADYDREKVPSFWQHIRPRPRAVSGLGLALLGQGRLAEAEPFVVGAYHELVATEQTLAGDRAKMIREATEAAVQLYTAWGQPAQADEWRRKLPSPLPL